MKFASLIVFLSLALCCVSTTQATVMLEIGTVPVGNANNTADSNGFGAVADDYRIGTTEVTNDQYVAFLNSVAAIDTHSLYNSSMNSSVRGGITQNDSSPNFSYSAKANMGNKPVNYVSFWDAARFSNWLHNGQVGGVQDNSTTEDGAYTLGGMTNPVNTSISRNAGATWFIPTENQWYKAAYHQPTADGGDGDDYWQYPTASNSVPTIATANSVGDISNPGANVANYANGADWNGKNGNVTTVGSAGIDSASFYGTSDQGGNVEEWNESLAFSSNRGLRGGRWNLNSTGLAASVQNSNSASFEEFNLGFRVASVPEPSTLLLGIIASMGLLVWRKKFS